MDKELEDLKTELAGLKDELTTAKTKVTDLEKEVQAKDSQIERLTSDAQGMQDKMSNTLAVSLASMRTRFGKQLPKGEDGKDLSVEQYVEKLSARSVESLQDSLSDLMFEIDQLPADKTVVDKAPVSNILNGDKITDPTPKNKGNAPKDKQIQAPISGADRFSKGLLS